MRRHLAGLIVSYSVASACASTTLPATTDQPQPSATRALGPQATASLDAGRPAGPFTSIDSLTLSDDRRHLSIEFVGARDPAEGVECSADYGAWTDVAGEVLQVGVFELARRVPSAPMECPSVGYFRSLEVRLEAPFAGREWHDLAGYRHFLSAPDGLVEIDLPDGWQLVAEGDVPGSATGRWERTYGPAGKGSPEQSLVLIQAFGASAGVTGGDEQRTVEVNGRPAMFYRHPPSGEMVLVWRPDRDGLVLVACEPALTVEDLIALAESAHLPLSSPASATPATSLSPSAFVPDETPVLTGSGHDARHLIWLEFLERAPGATCWAERNAEYDLTRLRQTANEIARDADVDVGIVADDWFVGPRVLAGRALAGGELLALPSDDVAWYASPTLVAERGSEMAAVMLFGFTVPDGRALWWRTADYVEVRSPPCPRPEHD